MNNGEKKLSKRDRTERNERTEDVSAIFGVGADGAAEKMEGPEFEGVILFEDPKPAQPSSFGAADLVDAFLAQDKRVLAVGVASDAGEWNVLYADVDGTRQYASGKLAGSVDSSVANALLSGTEQPTATAAAFREKFPA